MNAIRPGLTRAGGTAPIFADKDILAGYLAEYPLGRLGEPEFIGDAVRFLAGPESEWVKGRCLAVDGGNLLRRSPRIGTSAS